MKIRRFTGPDMRDCMRQVRETLGADAVILETVRHAQGIEISAAMDGHDTLAGPAMARPAGATARPAPRIDVSDEDGDCVTIAREPLAERHARHVPQAAGGELDTLREEVRSLRYLLENQLTRLVWDADARHTPEHAALLRHYAQLGIEADVARGLAAMPRAGAARGTWSAALQRLVEALPVASEDPVAQGGIWAIVGPTGAGKTTTVAKLAARAALKYGPGHIGLVTTDTFRVAARAQLETYGQILGVPVHQAHDAAGLADILDRLGTQRLVLIDTAGMGQRDPRLADHLARVTRRDIHGLLALPANGQAAGLQQIVDVFRTTAPAACILTKTDEAVSLGGALSVLIRSKLPLACVANGQQVPEDLHAMPGRQAWLVKMAVELMRRENRPLDEQFMAQRYTEVPAHAYA